MLSKIMQEDIERISSELEEHLYKLEGKTVLITGGNGFIPSYIVDVIANFNKRIENPCKLVIINKHEVNEGSRLSHLIEDPNVEFVATDVGKHFKVPGRPNFIIHAASRANPKFIFENPIDTMDANVNGIRTLLEHTKENPVEGFLFFSSSEVYGNPPKDFIPTSEEYLGNVNVLDKMACYAESKRFSETICFNFFSQYETPIKIARIFHTYGPGMRNDGKVITDFFLKGINNKKIDLRDPGEARRGYCYISDLITGILKILFEGERGEAYNVGSDSNNISIRELAFMIGKVLENGTVVKVPEREYKETDRILDRMPDLKKIKALGYEAKISVEEGLRKMKKDYEEKGVIPARIDNPRDIL